MAQKKNNTLLRNIFIVLLILVVAGFDIFIINLISSVEYNQIHIPIYGLILLINISFLIFLNIMLGKHKNIKRKSLKSLFDSLDVIKPTQIIDLKNDLTVLDSGDEQIEETSDVVILRPRQVIKSIHSYDKKIHFEKYLDQMYNYFIDNGLEVNKDTLKNTFAQLGATRLIYINQPSLNIGSRFIELFSDFLGSNLSILTDEGYTNYNEVLDEFISKGRTDSHKLNMLLLKNIDFKIIKSRYKYLLDYADNPVKFIDQDDLPNNLWIFIQHSKEEPKNELLDIIATIDLNAKVIEPQEEVHENEIKLSYERVVHMIRDLEEKYYLEEIHWKKIDQLENYISKYVQFKFDNKIIRQMERFSSIYILVGGDQLECLDNLLNSKIFPIVLDLNIKRQDKEDEGFIDLLDRIFGIENLIISKSYVKKLEDNFLSKDEVS